MPFELPHHHELQEIAASRRARRRQKLTSEQPREEGSPPSGEGLRGLQGERTRQRLSNLRTGLKRER